MSITEPSNIPHPWQQLAQDAFVAPLFNKEQCDSLLFAIQHPVDGMKEAPASPNNLHEYGAVVDDPMLQYWIDELGNKRLKPVIEKLFSWLPDFDLSSHYAFLTRYGEDANKALDLHVDASHITLNICLESHAQGSDLVFTGVRCAKHVDTGADENHAPVRFRQGDAVLHAGCQRHYVTALAGGSRHNLVIWYRLEGEAFDHSNPWVKPRCSECKAK